MWTRGKLKEAAKAALHRNYWKIVLVSMILMLLGCETGGLSFHKTVRNGRTDTAVEESYESGSLPTGKRSVVSVKMRADSDKVTVETIDDGEFASEEVEISFFEGLIVGFVAVGVGLILFWVVFVGVLGLVIFLGHLFCGGG